MRTLVATVAVVLASACSCGQVIGTVDAGDEGEGEADAGFDGVVFKCTAEVVCGDGPGKVDHYDVCAQDHGVALQRMDTVACDNAACDGHGGFNGCNRLCEDAPGDGCYF